MKQNLEKVKLNVEKFWEENGEMIKKTSIIVGYGLFAYLMGIILGDAIATIQIDVGLNHIADKTPELTFGEYKRLVMNKEFDPKKYW